MDMSTDMSPRSMDMSASYGSPLGGGAREDGVLAFSWFKYAWSYVGPRCDEMEA
jgi:hypothetical protein